MHVHEMLHSRFEISTAKRTMMLLINRFCASVTGLHPSTISCELSANQQQSLGA